MRRLASHAIGCLILTAFLCGNPADTRADDSPPVLFEENFAADLDPGWSWVREHASDWKLDKQKKELLIHAMPGVSLYNSRSLTNIFLREAPASDGPIACEVHVHHRPINGYETGGMIWYYDDDNCVQFNKELMGGTLVVVLGVKWDGKNQNVKQIPYDNDDVDLRLVVSGTNIDAQYREPASDKWQSLAQTQLRRDGKARVGLRAAYGPQDNPSWARFSRFRIRQLAK